MRRTLAALLALSCSCDPRATEGTPTPTGIPSATPTPTPTPTPGEMTLLRRLPHAGWSEGLEMHAGELWHAFPHSHRVYDPVTGAEKRLYDPPSEYSESLTWVNGTLWNVSFSDSNLWVGTPAGDTFVWEIAGTTPEIHAWGIAWTGEHVVVTGNGTAFLYFLDPLTTSLVRTLETPIDDLEDIAWDGEAIWATSFSDLLGQFFRIDPATGDVLDVHAVPEEEVAGCTDRILDGLAIADGLLYVTGKHCPYVWVYTLP